MAKRTLIRQSTPTTVPKLNGAAHGRTVYLKGVKPPNNRMLKPGANNKKLGGKVKVSMWQGMPIYQLTLEERKTCPSTCDQWEVCYGNNMPFAHRHDHTDKQFLTLLGENLDYLDGKHPDGYVVRLHVLGDFYDITYVGWWARQIKSRPNLRVYGYTHRLPGSLVGKAISGANNKWPDRCRVRFSDAGISFSTLVVKQGAYSDKKYPRGEYTVCPEQLEQTASCAECGLCWSQPDRKIIFMEH